MTGLGIGSVRGKREEMLSSELPFSAIEGIVVDDEQEVVISKVNDGGKSKFPRLLFLIGHGSYTSSPPVYRFSMVSFSIRSNAFRKARRLLKPGKHASKPRSRNI